MELKTEKILTLDEIRKFLEDKKLHIVAKKLNISYPTLKKLHDGKSNCNYNTLSKISNYIIKT